MTNRQCANELPGPGDVKKVQQPVSQQNVEDGYNHLMYVKVIALLLSNQDDNHNTVLDNQRLRHLAELLFFLVEHPSAVLGDVVSEREPGPADNIRVVSPDEGGAS